MLVDSSLPLAAALTSMGSGYYQNEERFGLFPELGLFVVVHGLWGSGGGGVVAEVAIEALREHFEATRGVLIASYRDVGDPGASRLKEGLRLAHKRIHERVGDHGAAILAALSLSAASVHFTHVGDSRIYRIESDRIEQLTEDHSLRNHVLREMPSLTADEIAQLPANVVTRALGWMETSEIDVHSFPLRPGDLYLLCTPGVYGFVPPEEMLVLVRESADLDAAARALMERAIERDGRVNRTCLLVRPLQGPYGSGEL